MFGKVLVCTDISPASDILVQCIGQLKNLGLEEVVLAHIIYVADTPGSDELMSAMAQPQLASQKKLLEQGGVKVVTEIPLGLPAQTLSDLAERHDVSAIVIGSHGRGIAGSMTLGSVSSKLLQITRRPVLLVRSKLLKDEGECLRECRNLFEHVLYPTDFSDTAERAFAYLENVVSALKCRVTLIHVQDRAIAKPRLSHRREELRRLDLARLERMKTRLAHLGAAQVTIELAVGTPGDEIVERAKAKDCSLILMGSRGKGLTRQILLGSVAHQVARHAERMVLFVPATQ